jgi:hypothetical protein
VRLLPIIENTWCFYTPCDRNNHSDLLVFLGNIDAKHAKSAAKLLAIIETASEEVSGPQCFDDSTSHYVDQNNKIYEFVAGRLRLLWFYSPQARKVVICSHVFMKSSQKIPKSEVRKAIKVKEEYESAQDANQITIVRPE